MLAIQNSAALAKVGDMVLRACDTFAEVIGKDGPRTAVTPKVRKLIAPVALPLTSSGLTSLIMVYGIIAAPEAIPKTSSLLRPPCGW